MATENQHPVTVIGAGPVGLAAAAHLIARGLPVRVYEAGATVAAHVRDWGHVRLFSPWEYNVDPMAREILLRHGWREPAADAFPTGAELASAYLEPLAGTPELAPVIETGARVSAISRLGIDKVGSRDRADRPFVLTVIDAHGGTRRELARAVIDASGTWSTQNPLGADGLTAAGEADNVTRVARGIPDVAGRERTAFQGRTTAVVGAGHSAATVLLDLARLAEESPDTRVVWVTRSGNLARVFGGGSADRLAARGALGSRLRALVDAGRVELVPGFAVAGVHRDGDRVALEGRDTGGSRRLCPVDRVVVATGQRPDPNLTREIRVDLDPALESVRALGPLIDPNEHSCGSVRPHGHRELAHPEPGFYTVGIKSYGRAPNFLMLTGYEQVRSVVAALAGDLAAADDVRLVLPETGVCSLQPAEAAQGCCGGTSVTGVAAVEAPSSAEPARCCGAAA
ncbi:FAD-dependent oxidoreductase [Methylobacterium persicinum]|uniref:Thioredoxin reductase n=1 Tax=Methylobacterium persicinum TaxID=374426 RepID=A0ABU0HJH3_9HYPH|nr:FAD-dependent oxidoreductase [Methylobacterium persicinum]MDQ0441865.1 thioredoxin reductase [Methylobacterium persicinum]GJE38047.1 Ferredoxin--NADP reductase [Methylobacterium persicinum]